MTEKATAKKSKEEILFPEVIIDNYTVKPWSFGMLFEISEMLEIILSKMDAKGISIDNLLVQSGDNVQISWNNLVKVFSLASDEVLRIISLTVNEDEAKIKSLDMQTGVKIAFTIFRQNKEVIKNALSSLS